MQTKNSDKNTSGKNSNKTNSKKNNGSNGKQIAGTASSSPSAREKAKDMDTKRRSDAESNEL